MILRSQRNLASVPRRFCSNIAHMVWDCIHTGRAFGRTRWTFTRCRWHSWSACSSCWTGTWWMPSTSLLTGYDIHSCSLYCCTIQMLRGYGDYVPYCHAHREVHVAYAIHVALATERNAVGKPRQCGEGEARRRVQQHHPLHAHGARYAKEGTCSKALKMPATDMRWQRYSETNWWLFVTCD